MATKFAKHDDATGFDFVNDTGAHIAAGVKLTLGGMVGITTNAIENGQAGHAEFLTGPAPVWRMYVDTSLLAAIAVGGEVDDPDDSGFVGYAVFGDVGRKPSGIDTPDDAAAIGDDVVYFVTTLPAPVDPSP